MNEIVTENLCMGCGACMNTCPKGCISMEPDCEGFLRPKINTALCIDCKRCQSVCPALSKNQMVQIPVHAYGAHSKDGDIVHSSSSGGIFTLLGREVLGRGGVAFGAAFAGPDCVRHIAIQNETELWRLRGSKYVQSKIGRTYQQAKQFLKEDRWVLFSGMPCQIAGLKAYLGREYEKLLCVDTICHSVPSPKVWQQFLKEAGDAAGSPVIRVNFREKQNSWDKYFLRLDFQNGKTIRYTGAENWYMQAFIQGMSTRPSCYSCKFKGENHFSDLTLGDFWGVRYADPECLYEDGTSLVLIHTEKGKQFLEDCRNDAVIQKTDFVKAIQGNPAYTIPSRPHRARELFFGNLGKVPIAEMVQQYLIPTRKELLLTHIRRCTLFHIFVRIRFYFKNRKS